MRHFVWLYQHMLLLVECVVYVICVGGVHCFKLSAGVYIYIFIGHTFLIIHGMVSTTEVTSDITNLSFLVALIYHGSAFRNLNLKPF
jgi:hypothetical protein